MDEQQKRSAVVIRPLTTADYETYTPLAAEADWVHHQALPALFHCPTRPLHNAQQFADFVSDESVLLVGAEHGSSLAGSLRASFRDLDEAMGQRARKVVFVDELVVDRRFKRRGIGRALMCTAQDWAIERNATTIELNVYEFNDGAQALYAALGYETLSRKLALSLVRK